MRIEFGYPTRDLRMKIKDKIERTIIYTSNNGKRL
jgi:hypothetical protein